MDVFFLAIISSGSENRQQYGEKQGEFSIPLLIAKNSIATVFRDQKWDQEKSPEENYPGFFITYCFFI
jgi:hypothetical protein